MSKSNLDRIVEGIDANLPELHQERWARQAANLREVIEQTSGAEQADARKALRAHYDTQFTPEASRGPLVEQARSKAATRRP